MRPFILALFAVACDTPQDTASYDLYDPAGVSEERAEGEMEYINVNARQEPWVHPNGQILAGFTAPQHGRWTWPGHEPGIASGDAACKALGGDHACTRAEIEAAAEAGDFKVAPVDVSIWLNDEDAQKGARCGGSDSHARLGGGGYTYDGGHRMWSGNGRTVPEVDGTGLVISDPPAVPWNNDCLHDPEACASVVPSGFPCNAMRAIACCK